MKYEQLLSLKTEAQLITEISLRGIRIRNKSTEEETFFLAHRTNGNRYSQSPLDYWIEGSLRPQERGTLVRFRILPGLSSILSLLFLLGMIVFSLCRNPAPESGPDPLSSPLFPILIGVTLLVGVVFFFLRLKEVRDDFLRNL